MIKRIFLLLVLLALPLPMAAHEEGKPIPRVLLALYDGDEEFAPRTTYIHRYLEMPANHLGFDIRYYDVRAPLPPVGDEVHGIVLWFNIGSKVTDPNAYLDWLNAALVRGKKLIVMENAGLNAEHFKDPVVMQKWNRALSYIGMQDNNSWFDLTYPAYVVGIDHEIMNFERAVEGVLPAFADTNLIPGKGKSHLQIAVPKNGDLYKVDLVTTSSGGGYIAEGFAVFRWAEEDKFEIRVTQWYVNPFEFLKRSLGTELMPAPDVTTLNGRRIFYSHIDGDGWNNISEIEIYRQKSTICAEVMRREILAPYDDFAFSVGLITADVDTNCYGVKDSEQAARDIFALPNVEPSSHTHSHPLFWRFFENYSSEKEKPLLRYFPPKPKDQASVIEAIKSSASEGEWSPPKWQTDSTPPVAYKSTMRIGKYDEQEEAILKRYDYVPRSYACEPFDIDQEITGSTAIINALSPPDKKVRLIQWSGNTSPFPGAIKKATEAGLLNINGGDSRFDEEYPSYASVAPIGLDFHGQRQIYSSNSNENTYTNLWRDRFFGFRYLQNTVMNTENPVRVSPFNIYFHMYSAQKQASINALKENLEFARRQNVTVITASQYSAIANGFYAAQLVPTGKLSWRVLNRGELQTMRFDDAEAYEIDFNHATGVIGQRYHQGSLYVALDEEVKEPVITLKNNKNREETPDDTGRPYLIESSWRIKNLREGKLSLTFQAHGYGKAHMTWNMQRSGRYAIRILKGDEIMQEFEANAGDSHVMTFAVEKLSPNTLHTFEITAR